MSSALVTYLELIAKEMSIYFGIPVLVAGTIGNILTILVFLSLRTFRRNSCAFYLTIMSVVNIGQLATGLLTRVMTTGFNIDWTQTSLFFCKFRYFIFPATSLISFTCICLATIDQYFATCSRPRLQQLCNIKLAQRVSTFFIALWTLHGIPYVILFERINIFSPDRVIVLCATTNAIFIKYHLYFISLCLTTFFQLVMTILFGILAYCNVRTLNYRTVPLVRRELEKQLTTMVLAQVVINVFTILPFSGVSLVSNTIVIIDPTWVAIFRLISTTTVLIYYFYFAVSFHWMSLNEKRSWNLLRRAHFMSMSVHPNGFADNWSMFCSTCIGTDGDDPESLQIKSIPVHSRAAIKPTDGDIKPFAETSLLSLKTNTWYQYTFLVNVTIKPSFFLSRSSKATFFTDVGWTCSDYGDNGHRE